MSLVRKGTVSSSQSLTGNIEYFTLFTTIDLTETGNYSDASQKDLESVVQVISLRGTPVILGEPLNVALDANGAPTLTGNGWIVKFAFEQEGIHTVETLTDELNAIVLNGGVIDTNATVNTEFTKTTNL